MSRIAKVRTLDTAWQLIDFLSREVRGCQFQIEMPRRDWYEIWPAHGYPLHPTERQLVHDKLAVFLQGASSPR